MARSVTHFDRAKRSVLLDRRHDLESELTTDPRLPSEVDRDGLTLLHYAAIKDRTDCLKVLVCAGGDCDAASKVNGFVSFSLRV
jgi:ankyrin repeat protein